MDLLRKLTLLFSGVCLAFVLTACGGPSKSDAGDFVLEIVESLYDGDVDPLLDAMAIDQLNPEDEEAARTLAKGKLEGLIKSVEATVESHDGLDDIEVIEVQQQQDNVFKVKIQVTYNDGTTEKQTTTVGWIEEMDRFWILE